MSDSYWNIHALHMSFGLTSRGDRRFRWIPDAVDGAVSALRFPTYSFTDQPLYELGVTTNITFARSGAVTTAQFGGDVSTPQFVTNIDRFHWDFWTVLGAVLIRTLIRRGIVAIHGACVTTTHATLLLPGSSGAGKSSIAYLALSDGASVHASEMSFVSKGRLIAGNAVLEIPLGALELFSLTAFGDDRRWRDRIVRPLLGDSEPVCVDVVVWPRVGAGPVRAREVSEARARTILFENVVGLTGVGGLVGKQGAPLAAVPNVDDLKAVATEVSALAVLPTWILEGSPQAVWQWVQHECG